MSFSPLPKTFLDLLHRPDAGPIVELGCGDGRFSALLPEAAGCLLRIDRRPPSRGTVADLVADARALPLTTGMASLLISPNLLRHLWPVVEGRPVPAEWLRCLRPGGSLCIFEDEPVSSPAAARHYRDLQAFLARLQPRERKPLLPRRVFERTLQRWEGPRGAWRLGRRRNSWPANSADVVRWLRALGRGASSEAGRLAAAIEKDGLAYGPYWWAFFQVEESSSC
jgi:SAM-dependent methyltransferase